MNYDNERKLSLWIKTSKKDGKKFMAGTVQINGIQYDVVIFKNDQKRSENSPDYQGNIKDKQTTQRNEYQNNKDDNNPYDPKKNFSDSRIMNDDEMPF